MSETQNRIDLLDEQIKSTRMGAGSQLHRLGAVVGALESVSLLFSDLDARLAALEHPMRYARASVVVPASVEAFAKRWGDEHRDICAREVLALMAREKGSVAETPGYMEHEPRSNEANPDRHQHGDATPGPGAQVPGLPPGQCATAEEGARRSDCRGALPVVSVPPRDSHRLEKGLGAAPGRASQSVTIPAPDSTPEPASPDAEELSRVRRLAYEFGLVGGSPRSLNLEEFLRGRLRRAEDASRLERAHRASWLLHRGMPPADKFVLHRCNNTSCVNPDHLYLGTHQQNMRDRRAAKREARGERNGFSKLSDASVRLIRKEWADGGWTLQQLGRKYGVDDTTISRVVLGLSWKHVTHAADAMARLREGR